MLNAWLLNNNQSNSYNNGTADKPTCIGFLRDVPSSSGTF